MVCRLVPDTGMTKGKKKGGDEHGGMAVIG
jgi:hypothetical protein